MLHNLGSNGRFYNLMNTSKRRRDEKIEKDKKNIEFDEMKKIVKEHEDTIDKLIKKVEYYEDEKVNSNENAEKLNKLYKMGLIDENGEPVKNFSLD